MMKKRGMKAEFKQYMDKCESYENDYRNYTLYIYGYWIPYLQQQIEKGHLKKGKEILLSFILSLSFVGSGKFQYSYNCKYLIRAFSLVIERNTIFTH